MRPLTDSAEARPKFVSEGLAFSIPPGSETVDDACGGARQAGHDPTWKRGIHHDTGGSWDLEDVRDHYVRGSLLGGPASPAPARSRAGPRSGEGCGRPCDVGGHGRVATPRIAVCRSVVGCPARPQAGSRLGSDRRPRASQGTLVLAGPGLRTGRGAGHRRGAERTGLHLVNDTGAAVLGSVSVELFSADHWVEEVTQPGRDPGPQRPGAVGGLPVRRVPGPDLLLSVRPQGLRAGGGPAPGPKTAPCWPKRATSRAAPAAPGRPKLGFRPACNWPMIRYGPCPCRPGALRSSSAWTFPGSGRTTRGSIWSRAVQR